MLYNEPQGPKVTGKRYNDLFLNIYDLAKIGDILQMHDHTAENVHITIVARGKVRVHGPGYDIEAVAGNVIDWQPGQKHEFVALEDNTRFINICKNYAYMSTLKEE